MSKKQLASNFILLLTAIIWGLAFVAQRAGMEYVGPFIFNAFRFALGGTMLLPVIFIMKKLPKKTKENHEFIEDVAEETTSVGFRTLLKAGIPCGLLLFVAATLQQAGMIFTSAGKAGFITALYIVLVPILGLFLKQKASLKTWLGVLIAAAGLYLLCVTDSFSIGFGDLIILIGAFFWAMHILIIDHYSTRISAIQLASTQFYVCAILSLILALIFETTTWEDIMNCMSPILYSGFLSVGMGFTLQIVGQKNAPPAVASIILSFEAVFGAIGGWLILSERLSPREFLGCFLMFLAIIISQIPSFQKKRSKVSE